MNSKSLRRLAADHNSLHSDGLPPNYLFPPGDHASDELTSLEVLLAGPQGTPYASGVWRLRLDIPNSYPNSPPTAAFKTRIWHPNVDENSGAVCVDTLKRDWEAKLTLRDILVTISCLLIYPNPASALNAEAGALLQEDYAAFARRATLMTSIHAIVPRDLQQAVDEARSRGDDPKADTELPAKAKAQGRPARRRIAQSLGGASSSVRRPRTRHAARQEEQRRSNEPQIEEEQQQVQEAQGLGLIGLPSFGNTASVAVDEGKPSQRQQTPQQEEVEPEDVEMLDDQENSMSPPRPTPVPGSARRPLGELFLTYDWEHPNAPTSPDHGTPSVSAHPFAPSFFMSPPGSSNIPSNRHLDPLSAKATMSPAYKITKPSPRVPLSTKNDPSVWLPAHMQAFEIFQAKTTGKPRGEEDSLRQKLEFNMWKGAGFSVKRWNKGDFGRKPLGGLAGMR